MKINSINNFAFSSKISTREQAGNELIKKGEIDKAVKIHGVGQQQMSEILPYVKTQVLYNSFKNEDSIMQFPQALSELAIRLCIEDKLDEAMTVYNAIPDNYINKESDIRYDKESVAKVIVSKAVKINDTKAGAKILNYFI